MDPEELENLSNTEDSSNLSNIAVMAGAALLIGIGSYLFGKRCSNKASSSNPSKDPVQVREDRPSDAKPSDETDGDDPIAGSKVD